MPHHSTIVHPLTISGVNPVKHAVYYLLSEDQVIKGKSYQVTFEFSNNTGRSLTVTGIDQGVDMSGFQKGTATCESGMPLPDKGKCYLSYVYMPEKQGDSAQALSVTMTYRIGEHTKTIEARKLVTVIAGKFIYKKDAKAIGSLTVKPGESNVVVKLTNDGKANVSGMALSIPTPVAGYVDKTNCIGLTGIYPDMSCDLVITVPYDIDSSLGGQYVITATSANVDNSPAKLYLDILTRGHLVVIKDQGGAESIYTLKQGSEGTLTVTNTGSKDISNFLFKPATEIASYFPGKNNTCRKKKGGGYKLKAGASCQIQYQIPTSPVDGIFTLDFKGDGADNLPQFVSVMIANKGHLIFNHNNLKTDLAEVVRGESGTISLGNRGGKDITDFSVELPEDIKNRNYITSNTCVRSDHTLKINATCKIKYMIPPEANIGTYTFKVRGNDFDNEDPSFFMSILAGKPYYSFDFLPDYIHGNTVDSNVAGLSSLSLYKSPSTNQIGPKGLNNAIGFDGVDQYAKFDDTSKIVSGNFTIDFWGIFDSFSQKDSKILDMGKGKENDNIAISHRGTTEKFALDIYRGRENKTTIVIGNFWVLHKWFHATISMTDKGVVHIYRNGKYIDLNSPPDGVNVLEKDQPGDPVSKVERRKSYIGKSNNKKDGFFQGKIANLVIYNGIVEPEQGS